MGHISQIIILQPDQLIIQNIIFQRE